MKFNVDKKFSIGNIFSNSFKLYKSNKVDDKNKRANLDIISGKIITKNNFKYDRSKKQWVQTNKTSKLIFEIKTNPISYKKIDTIKIHKYPVIIEFKNVSMGLETPFKWREGDQKAIVFNKPGMTSEEIANINIKNKSQLQFFFDMEWVAKMNNLLYGRNRAKWFPRITNPRGYIYFGKHAFFLIKKIVLPLLGTGKLNQKPVKNLNYGNEELSDSL